MNKILSKTLKPGADVVILVNLTGSKPDDVHVLRNELARLQKTLSAVQGIRIGIASYGSNANSGYVTWYQSWDFSGDVAAQMAHLKSIMRTKINKTPESVYDGIVRVVKGFEWKEGKQHVLVVVGGVEELEGGEKGSRYNGAEVVKECKGRKVNLFGVVCLGEREGE
jgi:hypothetical protein